MDLVGSVEGIKGVFRAHFSYLFQHPEFPLRLQNKDETDP